ncbi:laminin subunit beta-4 [Pholidichthys leucotaenia]
MISIFLIIFLPAAHLQDPRDPLEVQEPCPGSSCNPQLGDLLVGRAAQLSASSTCGLNGPQKYCIVGYLEEEQKCFTCDSRLPYDSHGNPDSHRIENIVTTFDPDRKLKWWQSENGVHQVSIRLDLETVFQFSHLVLTFRSFRPAAMLVERSRDFGRTWKVFRYFAEDCSLHFPWASDEPADNVDDIVCDSRYSGPDPSTDGEVVLKALDPVFKIENPYAPHIQDLITVTNIRVNFTRLFTLGDTLLGRRRRNPLDKYYYAVYDMVVRGSCFCHGHADRCVPTDGGRGDVFTTTAMVHGRCVCQHRTAGENCERCQDFHHDSPWRPGGENAQNICRRCNCHGHADSCHFDAARYEASGGVSGGVCDDCRNDRMGPQCEQCRPFLYQDPQRSMEDPQGCIPCDCDPAGSRDGGLCDALSGRCVCKENVEGDRCDRCKRGFFALRGDDADGCQACRCHPLGSVGSCDQQTGSCQCDRLAVGPLCDRCLPGFWGLGNSVFTCSPCSCDVGGAHDSMCSPEDGQCRCLPNMIGRDCSDPAPGYFLPPLDYFLYEAELAAPLQGRRPPVPPPYPTPPAPPAYPTPPPFTPPPFTPPPAPPPAPLPYPYPYPHLPPFTPPSPPPPAPPLPHQPYPTPPPSSPLLNPAVLPQCVNFFRERGFDFKYQNGRVVLVRRSRRLTAHHRRRRRRRRQDQENFIPLDPGHALQIVPRQRSPGQLVTWTGLGLVRVSEGAGLRFTVDNLPSSMEYQLVMRYEPESPSDWLASISITMLSPGNSGCNSHPSGSKTLVLPGNSRGSVMDSSVCLNAGGRYWVDVVFHEPSGSEGSHILIDSLGLIPRMESVQDLCSQSDLDSFRRFRCVGLAVSGEPLPEACEGLVKSMSAQIHNGAIPCRCNLIGSLGLSCSKLGGFCDCKPNVIGRCCDSCAPLTFGFGPEGCKSCDCDLRGSLSELCDEVTGHCQCRSEVRGHRCDRCLDGFWGFPACRPCRCNGLSETCHPESGECLNCRENAAGQSCDRCVEGYHGDPISGQPCQPCLCPDVEGSGRFFATSCRFNPQSLSLTCDCREGHTGPTCDRCSPGFYGNLTSPGAVCQECPCNNNIDPNDRNACSAITGECLHCLHNTTGPRCQTCKPGYYGDALVRGCRECSCDRRGTEVTRCPLGSPCFCDPTTGRCPCRRGVTGDLCDRCEDGFWNLDGASGCQPCSCDPANTLSNVCDKVTGQCPCSPEFGGRQCDECGENHFGNPDLQCIPCDCNLKGTKRPSCDPETGECLCRSGVTGTFCDQCAPGYDVAFPKCRACHPCNAIWTNHLIDVKRAAERMTTFIPRRPNDDPQPSDNHQKRMLGMHLMMDELTNLTRLSPEKLEDVEGLLMRIRKLKAAMDPNMVIFNPSVLLNTEMENIRLEFDKLQKNLKNKVAHDPSYDQKNLKDLQDEIQRAHEAFMLDEKRVRNAMQAVEDSMDTRQEAKRKVAECGSCGGDLAPLEKKVEEMNVTKLNQKVCGRPGLDNCSSCGSALCTVGPGQRNCSSPNCDGVVPLSEKAAEGAAKLTEELFRLPSQLQDSRNKINNAKQAAQDTKDRTRDLQDQIKDTIDSFEEDKQKTKELLQKVKDFLLDDSAPPEDIEKMSRAVLNIQLPRSPSQIRSMIREINDLMTNNIRVPEDLKNLEEEAKVAKDLLQKAQEVRERAESSDTAMVITHIYEADRVQSEASDLLDRASRDGDQVRGVLLLQTEEFLDDVEAKLQNFLAGLLDQIQSVKNKSESNREAAREARDAAEDALSHADHARTELGDVLRLFEDLKQNPLNETSGGEAAERLEKIRQEAEDLRRDVEQKLLLIFDVEQKILQLHERKKQKSDEVSELLKRVEELRNDIVAAAEKSVSCRV